jgi:YggT family protein
MVFDNPLLLIITVVNKLLGLYSLIVFIRVILSWVRPDPYNPLVRFIFKLVDPVTEGISRIIPTRAGMIDFSAVILIVAISLLRGLLNRLALSAIGLG